MELLFLLEHLNRQKSIRSFGQNKGLLSFHTHNLCHKLKSILGSEFHVEYAIRYKNPSFKKILSSWEGKNFKQIIIIPLFPQYASATNGSVIEQGHER